MNEETKDLAITTLKRKYRDNESNIAGLIAKDLKNKLSPTGRIFRDDLRKQNELLLEAIVYITNNN